ncbi:hypothetical protein [Mesoterricola silvestris]|uniref:hypothetical protein n=1 Tax=Mesoterricola silvestris TaxID=2927979 RepID=UPI00292E0B4B|nr:hypothetical protein [Mesoterricola silvestris]
MDLHVIYTKAEMLLSKKSYTSWRDIQDEYEDYMASFGPWSIEQVLGLFEKDYPDLDPVGLVQVEILRNSPSETIRLTFKSR